MPRRLLLAFLLALAPATAFAGVTLVWEMPSDTGGKPEEVTTYLDGEKMRMASPDGVLIHRGDRKVTWFIDAAEKSYMEMTAEQGRAARQGLAAAQAQAMRDLEQQMRGMPEAQRKQVEEMLKAMPGAPKTPPKVIYRKLGAGKTVGRWRCEDWEQVVDGKKEAVFCWARLAELGLGAADLKPLLSLHQESGFAESGGGMGAADIEAMATAIGHEGLPIRAAVYDDGKLEEQMVLKKIERGNLPATLFEVPAGYRKEAMELPGKR